MKNFQKFNERIMVGLVPKSKDLNQLKKEGYKTIIDMREKDEKYGDYIESKSKILNLNYINIPAKCDVLEMEDLKKFYQEVYREGSAPIYVFSRFGCKPTLYLMIFDAISNNKPIINVYRNAAKRGFKLDGDICLQKYLYNLLNTGDLRDLVDSVRKSRTDLFDEKKIKKEQIEEDEIEIEIEAITDKLESTSSTWLKKRDISLLLNQLESLVGLVKAHNNL